MELTAVKEDADSSMTSESPAVAGLVSVIMPCKNAAPTIAAAIESVLEQGKVPIELIIVDDGSVDGTSEIVSRYCEVDSRITFLRNRGRGGVAGARNTALRSARGQFICFLDSDDYLLPDSIFSRVEALCKTGNTVGYSPYLRLLPGGDLVLNEVPASISFMDMWKKNFIGNLTGIYDASALGKFYQQEIRHEDYLMWCQIVRAAGSAVSAGVAPLAVYRVSSESLSGNKWKAVWWHWRVLVDGLGLGYTRAMYYQLVYVASSVVVRLRRRIFGRG
jgi:glycosyltransferase involved in cell wall biosynthesis